ncbi:MAG: hypothetical protein AAB225_08275, partial [Acidobacteriota bacterium]
PLRAYRTQHLNGVAGTITASNPSELFAGPEFAGNTLIELTGMGGLYTKGSIENLTFRSSADSGIAAIRAAPDAIVTNSRFSDLTLWSSEGIILDTYTQNTFLEHIVACGPVNQFVLLRGNFNLLRDIDKECDSGTSPGAFVSILKHKGLSTGNTLQHILIEGRSSSSKSLIRLDGTKGTTIQNVWFEVNVTNGYGIEIENSYDVTFTGLLFGIDPSRRIKIRNSAGVWIERLDFHYFGARRLDEVIDADDWDSVTVAGLRLRDGSRFYNLTGPDTDLFEAGKRSLERRAAAPPAAGTWRVGDVVWNSVPTPGGYAGWICVTAGTPGVWKEFGPIAP